MDRKHLVSYVSSAFDTIVEAELEIDSGGHTLRPLCTLDRMSQGAQHKVNTHLRRDEALSVGQKSISELFMTELSRVHLNHLMSLRLR